METSKITKIAKVLNIVEIVVTVVMFIMFNALNTVAKSATTQEEFDKVVNIQTIALFILGAISVVVIALTAFLMAKNQKRVKGLGCLLASGIITLLFSITGLMLGIIVWVLSGISLKSLKQKDAEEDFKAQLNLEANVAEDNAADTADASADKIYE